MEAFFTDDALASLGSLASGSALVGSDSILTLTATLSVTTDAAKSGFFGDIVIGDPPAASPPSSLRTASPLTFTAQMAAFGAASGAGLHAGAIDQQLTPLVLAAAR
jgi:hypothetical protein